MIDGSHAWKSRRRQRWQRYWNRHAQTYDREMALLDRVLFRDTRRWICTQATGQVLEVAIGTGLNIALYPPGVALTGIDLSPAMLAIARRRAHELGRTVDLRCGNAETLTFPDASFDTVVCTFSLCAIPDHEQAVAEMVRVLRPGATLLLADHVAAAHLALRAVQGVAELISVPLGGEHFRRRPIELVRAAGLEIERHDRFAAGIVERLAARVPTASYERNGFSCGGNSSNATVTAHERGRYSFNADGIKCRDARVEGR